MSDTTFTDYSTVINAEWLNDVNDLTYSYVNVKTYGAIGDGSTDDTAAIQAAIDAGAGKVVFFPTGSYKITDTLYVRNNSTMLKGAGVYSTSILAFTGNSAIIFDRADSTATGYLSNCGVTDLRFNGKPTGVTGHTDSDRWVVQVIKCENFVLSNVIWVGFYYGVKFAGGQLNKATNFIGQGSLYTAGTAGPADSCQLCFETATTSGGEQLNYSAEIAQFSLSGGTSSTLNERIQHLIRVNAADGLHLVNGYIAHAGDALILINPLNTSTAVTCLTNMYLDGVYLTPYGIKAYNTGAVYTSSLQANSGTFIGQTATAGIYVNAADTGRNYMINAVRIANITGYAIDFDGGNASTLNVAGCLISNCYGGIKVVDAEKVTLSGNSIYDITADEGLLISGTVDYLTATGNTFENITGADYSNTGTVTTTVFSGNSTDAASATITGTSPGNIANTSTTVLDYYLEGTFTPAVEFGGASTGITYTSRSGSYTRIGNTIQFTINILLSSKGSSTGTVRITGLPVTCSESTPLSVYLDSVGSTVGNSALMALLPLSSTSPRIDTISSGSLVQLTDAEFTNTSNIKLSGTYRV